VRPPSPFCPSALGLRGTARQPRLQNCSSVSAGSFRFESIPAERVFHYPRERCLADPGTTAASRLALFFSPGRANSSPRSHKAPPQLRAMPQRLTAAAVFGAGVSPRGRAGSRRELGVSTGLAATSPGTAATWGRPCFRRGRLPRTANARGMTPWEMLVCSRTSTAASAIGKHGAMRGETLGQNSIPPELGGVTLQSFVAGNWLHQSSGTD
jgi:hypothetical protein